MCPPIVSRRLIMPQIQELLEDPGELGLEEYQRSCAAVTSRFAELSHRIRAVESALLKSSSLGCPGANIAKNIRAVQELEKEKLQLVRILASC